MNTTTIQVPDMQTAHCQSRVKNAVGSLSGVTLNSIEAGSLTVSLENPEALKAVTDAVSKAGYTVGGTTSEAKNADGSFQFKTNINCGGCVAKVTPALNEASGIESWQVDTTNKDKILSVKSAGITQEQVMDTVKKAGFRIEPVEQ
ncbi:MAG: heavy-metal-associated domain-containing protein [Cyclobacteriaceae bacterium]|nr:heavy-metal-associated domain-containing protein [Cyclobacteriaceae bacterium]